MILINSIFFLLNIGMACIITQCVVPDQTATKEHPDQILHFLHIPYRSIKMACILAVLSGSSFFYTYCIDCHNEY